MGSDPVRAMLRPILYQIRAYNLFHSREEFIQLYVDLWYEKYVLAQNAISNQNYPCFPFGRPLLLTSAW
jgi:hypothetical protein